MGSLNICKVQAAESWHFCGFWHLLNRLCMTLRTVLYLYSLLSLSPSLSLSLVHLLRNNRPMWLLYLLPTKQSVCAQVSLYYIPSPACCLCSAHSPVKMGCPRSKVAKSKPRLMEWTPKRTILGVSLSSLSLLLLLPRLLLLSLSLF